MKILLMKIINIMQKEKKKFKDDSDDDKSDSDDDGRLKKDREYSWTIIRK